MVFGGARPKSLWVSDGDAAQCQNDECAARFGMLRRRHHCRACGRVFCARCASTFLRLWLSPEDGVEGAYSLPPGPGGSWLGEWRGRSADRDLEVCFRIDPHGRNGACFVQSRFSGVLMPVTARPDRMVTQAMQDASVCVDLCSSVNGENGENALLGTVWLTALAEDELASLFEPAPGKDAVGAVLSHAVRQPAAHSTPPTRPNTVGARKTAQLRVCDSCVHRLAARKHAARTAEPASSAGGSGALSPERLRELAAADCADSPTGRALPGGGFLV